MTKQEILNAIENGKSVWVDFNKYSYENDSVKEIEFSKVENINLCDNYFQYFDCKNLHAYYYKSTFKTKAEAEHYLHHANITRTETLPFLTWEEFNEKGGFDFIGKNLNRYEIIINIYNNKISIYENDEIIKNYDLTEENFYKAYDECVRLFRGGE